MKKLNISEDINFSVEEITGKCIGILGIRGSGKSNTAGVIFEELLDYNYPLTIVDIDGEYFGLKEEFEILVVGEGENVDLKIEPEDAPQVAEISIRQSIPVVLDLSGYLKEDQRTMLKGYFTRLWNLAGKLRKPYMIGIEESHEFIPQGKRGELKEIITRIALRGRKRGLGAVVISQRSAKVDKDVLTQAGMLFLHRVVHEADMKVYNDLLPWPKSEVREKVGLLDTGDCIFLSERSAEKIYVRERSTFHAGFTPSLDTVETPQLKQVGQSILEAIEKAKKKGRRKKSRIKQLEEKVDDLQAELTTKKDKIEELKDTARTLGYIQIDMENLEGPKVQNISKAIVKTLEIENVLKEGKSDQAHEAVEKALGETKQQEEISSESRIDYRQDLSSEGLSPQQQVSVPSDNDPESKQRAGYKVDGESSPGQRKREVYDDLPSPIKNQVRRVVGKIKRNEPIKRRILSFLIEHRPHAYSVDQISAWTDIPVSLVMSNRPQEFVTMGLLQIESKSCGLHYRCRLNSFVEKEFAVFEPDLTPWKKHLVLQQLEDLLISLDGKNKDDNEKSKKYVKVGGQSYEVDRSGRTEGSLITAGN